MTGYFLNPKLESFINYYYFKSPAWSWNKRQWIKPNNFQPLLWIYISNYLPRNYQTCVSNSLMFNLSLHHQARQHWGEWVHHRCLTAWNSTNSSSTSFRAGPRRHIRRAPGLPGSGGLQTGLCSDESNFLKCGENMKDFNVTLHSEQKNMSFSVSWTLDDKWTYEWAESWDFFPPPPPCCHCESLKVLMILRQILTLNITS